MKAIICKNYGDIDELEFLDVDTPDCKDNEVLISVAACGVNFPDTLIVQGKYQFKPNPPFSPGGEVSGVIKKVGANVENFKIGDKVIAFTTWGGFAEEISINQTKVLKIPDTFDLIDAAGFVLTYGTSYHALFDRAQFSEGETILVLGASGGVGLAAIQLSKIQGLKVIAAASTDNKLNICKENGADFLINYKNDDIRKKVKEFTQGQGVDVIYDPVGGELSEIVVRDMKWNGRYLVVGFAAGTIPKLPLNLPLLKGCSIVGVFWGSFTEKESTKNFQNNQKLFELYQDNKLKPHIHKVFPLKDAIDALKELQSQKVSGKVILKTDNLD